MQLTEALNFLAGAITATRDYSWNDLEGSNVEQIERVIPLNATTQQIEIALLLMADQFVNRFPSGTVFTTDIPAALEGKSGWSLNEYGIPIFGQIDGSMLRLGVGFH